MEISTMAYNKKIVKSDMWDTSIHDLSQEIQHRSEGTTWEI